MLKSYASYFVAYLLSNLGDVSNIERIILYGSVARDEGGKESDVDLFVEIKDKNVEKKIRIIEKKFYQSREAALFMAKGVDNKINIKTGKLREWKDLYRSVASTGIILYGHYEAKELPSGVKHFLIAHWDKIGRNRGAFLNRIYGFTVKNKHYSGLLEEYDGRKIGKSAIMLPIQYKRDILKLIREYEVRAKVLEVFS